MKLLLENWRKYLNEEVKFSGILKLMPEPQVVSQAKSFIKDLPDEAQYLGDDRLHITLAHQSVLKPFRKQLKAMAKAGELPQEPVIVSEDLEDMWEVRPADGIPDELGRKSWVVWLTDEAQEKLQAYMNEVMDAVDGPENIWEKETPVRKFHISLANLTGMPGDSVR